MRFLKVKVLSSPSCGGRGSPLWLLLCTLGLQIRAAPRRRPFAIDRACVVWVAWRVRAVQQSCRLHQLLQRELRVRERAIALILQQSSEVRRAELRVGVS